MMEVEVTVMWPRAKGYRRLQTLEEARKQILLWSLQREPALRHLDFGP